ncbi:MAG: prepilin-type N-terminal cleavage/methylation domain-containing protein [bacterium]|nr:prepilin-type N-terminal cleavage/methylation domain-containing protein [bacterium]
MKKKAFTFVELLLVMLVLGIIISLTLPIIKNIKDDEDIYRSYMKKANQDITDAMSMIFIREPNFTGFEMFEAPAGSYDNDLVKQFFGTNIKNVQLRNAFNKGLNTFECGVCTDADSSECAKLIVKNAAGYDEERMQCAAVSFQAQKTALANNIADNQPGLILAGKPIFVFQYQYFEKNDALNRPEPIYGFVYVDMNKDKGPNELCKDRYRFIIYNDRVAMDGCNLEL